MMVNVKRVYWFTFRTDRGDITVGWDQALTLTEAVEGAWSCVERDYPGVVRQGHYLKTVDTILPATKTVDSFCHPFDTMIQCDHAWVQTVKDRHGDNQCAYCGMYAGTY